MVSFAFLNSDYNSTIENETTLPITLKNAIEMANENVGTDSIYLSAFKSEYQPDQYLISDHLVLVNDLLTETDLLSKEIQFSVATELI